MVRWAWARGSAIVRWARVGARGNRCGGKPPEDHQTHAQHSKKASVLKTKEPVTPPPYATHPLVADHEHGTRGRAALSEVAVVDAETDGPEAERADADDVEEMIAHDLGGRVRLG